MKNIGQTGKRKVRHSTVSNTSSNSSVCSPDDKRVCGSGSSNDEVFEALEMAGSLGDQINQILQKLEKLEDIDQRLVSIDSKVSTLESKINLISSRQESLEKDMAEITRSVSFAMEQVDHIATEQKQSVKTLENNINETNRSILYLNAYSRRVNLNFFGISEQDDEDVEDKLRSFLSDALKISDAKQMEFQRIHRLGSKRPTAPRPIIVRFLRFPDRERVLKSAYQLKGTIYRIMEDFPKEIIEARRKLIPLLKQAKSDGKRAGFSKAMPDKLVINGSIVNS